MTAQSCRRVSNAISHAPNSLSANYETRLEIIFNYIHQEKHVVFDLTLEEMSLFFPLIPRDDLCRINATVRTIIKKYSWITI